MVSPTFEESRSGTYTESYDTEQFGVFTTTKEGEVKFVSSCVSASSALSKAALYYHKMNEYDHNVMDMSEIERFVVRVRTVTYSPWHEGSIPAKEAAAEDNPWRTRHWS